MTEANAQAARVYDQYRRYVNPTLALLMKLSGSPVETHAGGTRIYDETGKSYLDFAGGYGVFTLGHRHPRVIAAVQAQLERMALSGKTMFNSVLGDLAQRLAELTPGDLAVSFFCNSGTEAVEGALKLARAATGRSGVLAMHDGYHGKTLGSLSVSGREVFREPFLPLLENVVRVPFDDLVAVEATLDSHATRIGALLVEPVQGEGGVVVPRDGYLRGLRELCDRFNICLIFDEVQSGLGRCGTRFACDHEGVVPDIMTLAKGLSGGVVPIGAYISSMQLWRRAYGARPLLHTSTFGGNQLACAAALEALAVLEDEGLAENARLRGRELVDGLIRLQASRPEMIHAVRGRGLLVGVELCSEGYGGLLIPEMLKRGVTVAWTLNRQSVIRFEPPLIVTEYEVAAALDAFAQSLEAVFAELGILS